MTGEEPTAQRGRDVERFLTFVDAVVAIAITLLVLPLVEVAAEITTDSDVGRVLSEHTDQFFAFLLSFVVISRLWFAQHAVLRPVVALGRHLPFLVMTWLLGIVALPFETALIAQAASSPVSQTLYLGTLAAASAAMTVVSVVVDRDPSLRDGPASDPARSLGPGVVFLLTLGLVLVVPAVSFWPLLLLYVSDPAATAWRRRRRRHRRPPG